MLFDIRNEILTLNNKSGYRKYSKCPNNQKKKEKKPNFFVSFDVSSFEYFPSIY